MQPEIRITESDWQVARDHLLQDDDEHAAVLLCGTVRPPGEPPVLMTRRVVLLGAGDVFTGAGGLHLEVAPLTIARLMKEARAAGLSLVFCHSHPFPAPARPSPIDLATEAELCGRVGAGRLEGRALGGMVVGPADVSARVWHQGQAAEARVVSVGSVLRRLDRHVSDAIDLAPFDRQILLWGELGQRRLAATRLAVVGLGGTGSQVATQLAHLGACDVVLIDPDTVEESNLSRVVGSTPTSVGASKVEVARRMVRSIRPNAEVEAIAASVLDIEPSVLASREVILCCTDGHGSRLLLSELAAQYLVPVIDMGIEIQSGDAGSRAGGGVRAVLPGRACLLCQRILDPHLIREEFLSDQEREVEARRGYLRSVDLVAPSVIALNGVVASLAVVELFAMLTGVFGGAVDRSLYRAEQRTVSTTRSVSSAGCYVCGDAGLLGLGDSRPLPRRRSRAG